MPQTAEFIESDLGKWLKELGADGNLAFVSRADPSKLIPPQVAMDSSLTIARMPYFMANLSGPMVVKGLNGVAGLSKGWIMFNKDLFDMHHVAIENKLRGIKSMGIFNTVWGANMATEDYKTNVELALAMRNKRITPANLDMGGMTEPDFLISRMAILDTINKINHRSEDGKDNSPEYVEYRQAMVIVTHPELLLTNATFLVVDRRVHIHAQEDVELLEERIELDW